jgi:hypothetical protein
MSSQWREQRYALGAEHVYMKAPGSVMRCCHCEDILLVITHRDGGYLLGFQKMMWLELGEDPHHQEQAGSSPRCRVGQTPTPFLQQQCPAGATLGPIPEIGPQHDILADQVNDGVAQNKTRRHFGDAQVTNRLGSQPHNSGRDRYDQAIGQPAGSEK